MLAIINAELVMHNHFIPEAVLFVEDGIITGYGEMRNTPIPEGCEIIDAEGAYVGPGLIDIHNHAGGGHWFYDEPEKAAMFNLEHGTTTILACLYFNMNKDQLVEQAKFVQAAMKKPECKNVAGFYMEAPSGFAIASFTQAACSSSCCWFILKYRQARMVVVPCCRLNWAASMGSL